MKLYFSIIFLLTFYLGNAQKQYPRNYFSAPLKIPIILSGTFGELRSNHFHSGIDIKTAGKEGLPIYAPANGYVSRIKVSQYGFGKGIYLRHPNGYTTVYAHLQKFEPNIQKYVKSIQYKKKSYQTGNLFLKQDQFPVKKGQIIGYTGDTGGSGGPHLHYEIRNTATEHIINPLLFGLQPKDDTAPTLQKLIAYPLNEQSRVNNSDLKSVISFKKTNENNYISERITASGVIGFGVSVFDRLNDALNKNGIYSLEMKVNGSRVYYHDVETFSFSESKYINLLIDYNYYKTYKDRIQKTHKVSANRLNLYEDLVNNGKINIENGASYQVEIIAKDIKHNTTAIKIPIKGVKNNLVFKQKDTTNYKIIAKNFHKYTLENVTIAFPKNTFYSDCFIEFSIDKNVVKVHDATLPIDKRYTLTFDTSLLNEKQKQHVYIANVTNKKYPRYVNTKKKINKIYTSTKVLGSYKLLFDSIQPTIKLYNFADGQWLSENKTLKVKIKDNESGIKNFNATIDGKWILMEYNHKKRILTYNFDDRKLVGSKHLFKLVVSDNVGNLKTFSTTFFKK